MSTPTTDEPTQEPDAAREAITRRLRGIELLSLGQPLSMGAPRFPVNPPFMYSLTMRHDDHCAGTPGERAAITSASDAFAMGCHVGTHIDSLSHCAVDGCLHDGTNVFADGGQDDAHGIRMNRGQPLEPLLAPAVLLDFPAMLGVERVPDDYEVTAERIDACAEWAGVQIAAGDAVLIRTGWDTLWADGAKFLGPALPGPTPDAARHLASKGIVATGSDTMPYERVPSEAPLEVHAILLVEAGIYILEALNLAELGRRRVYRFLFSVQPLRIAGATGSPVNPVAIVFPEEAR